MDNVLNSSFNRSGKQKAAYLLIMLGKNQASKIMRYFNEEEIKSDLTRLQSTLEESDFEFIQNNYWERAIPLYDLNRSLAIERLHTLAQGSHICLFGNYVAGISLREMISAAKNFANKSLTSGGPHE